MTAPFQRIYDLFASGKTDTSLIELENLSSSERAHFFVWSYNNYPIRTTNPIGGLVQKWRSHRQVQARPEVTEDTLSVDGRVTDYRLDCQGIGSLPSIASPKLKVQTLPGYKLLPAADYPRKKNYHPILFLLQQAMQQKISHERHDFDVPAGGEYILPAGSLLYHGSSTHTRMMRKNFTDILWATRDQHEATRYAMDQNVVATKIARKIYRNLHPVNLNTVRAELYEFRTKKDLKMFNVNLDSIRQIKHDHPELQKLVESIYPIENDLLGRQSVVELDWIWANYLCNALDYSGYIANAISGATGYFHHEIMICQTQINETRLIVWNGATLVRWVEQLDWLDSENLPKLNELIPQVNIFLKFYASLYQKRHG